MARWTVRFHAKTVDFNYEGCTVVVSELYGSGYETQGHPSSFIVLIDSRYNHVAKTLSNSLLNLHDIDWACEQAKKLIDSEHYGKPTVKVSFFKGDECLCSTEVHTLAELHDKLDLND